MRCLSVASYPDKPQLNTSFPILIRTSPTSNVPAEPFSSEPSWAFNAGTMVSGSCEIAGKAESLKGVVKETGSRGSEVWVVES